MIHFGSHLGGGTIVHERLGYINIIQRSQGRSENITFPIGMNRVVIMTMDGDSDHRAMIGTKRPDVSGERNERGGTYTPSGTLSVHTHTHTHIPQHSLVRC